MEFIAIDFETANRYNHSAVSVGLTRMDHKGNVLDSYYTLIRPRYVFFESMCMSVNGLSEDEIRRAETLENLWPEMRDFIGNLPLVAHNAAFDMSVLKGSLGAWGLEVPSYEYYCTLQLSRRLMPCHESHALTALVHEVLSIDYNAHNAADDAYVCGRLFCYMLSREGIADKDDLDDYLQFRRLRYPKVILT